MGSVEDKIQGAVSKNRDLLSILSETDHGPAALEQQSKNVKDLTADLSKLDSEIQELSGKREKELKDHEKYRDSVMKRFAYRVGRKQDKFEAKADQEEKEYFDALHAEHRAKENRKALQDNLQQAENQKASLENVVARHRQAQADLDALYDSIFEGPTPGFPDEDAKEQAAEQTLRSYHDLRLRCESEQHALTTLSQANTKMHAALTAMDEARSHSQMDMFANGPMWDMMERSALSRAESLASEVQILVMQAQRSSPQVGQVPKPQISQGNLMSDVMFDNIFSDHAFHQKIKQSQDEMHASARVLDSEGLKCKQRIDGLLGTLKVESQRLEAARVDLQKCREMAFERVTAGVA